MLQSWCVPILVLRGQKVALSEGKPSDPGPLTTGEHLPPVILAFLRLEAPKGQDLLPPSLAVFVTIPPTIGLNSSQNGETNG